MFDYLLGMGDIHAQFDHRMFLVHMVYKGNNQEKCHIQSHPK